MRGETNWRERIFEGRQDSRGFFCNLGLKLVCVHLVTQNWRWTDKTQRMKPGKGPAQLWVPETMSGFRQEGPNLGIQTSI